MKRNIKSLLSWMHRRPSPDKTIPKFYYKLSIKLITYLNKFSIKITSKELKMNILFSGLSMEHCRLIFIAVSILSPVNIHIFILAFLKDSKHYSTLFYSKSSMPVAPTSIKSCSRCSWTFFILFS